jgi:hypothetical protein
VPYLSNAVLTQRLQLSFPRANLANTRGTTALSFHSTNATDKGRVSMIARTTGASFDSSWRSGSRSAASLGPEQLTIADWLANGGDGLGHT